MPRVRWIRPPYTRGLPPEERFWSYVEKTDACWLWRGTHGKKPNNYGRFDLNSRAVPAHRFSLTLAHGPIPAGLYALHHCDNPQCVRPEHLYAGTAKQNAADRERRGRRTPASGERHHNARLSDEDVYAIRLMAGEGWPLVEIHRHFPISYTGIKRIVSGRVRVAA